MIQTFGTLPTIMSEPSRNNMVTSVFGINLSIMLTNICSTEQWLTDLCWRACCSVPCKTLKCPWDLDGAYNHVRMFRQKCFVTACYQKTHAFKLTALLQKIEIDSRPFRQRRVISLPILRWTIFAPTHGVVGVNWHQLWCQMAVRNLDPCVFQIPNKCPEYLCFLRRYCFQLVVKCFPTFAVNLNLFHRNAHRPCKIEHETGYVEIPDHVPYTKPLEDE